MEIEVQLFAVLEIAKEMGGEGCRNEWKGVRFRGTYRGWEHTCKSNWHFPSLKLTLNVPSVKASPGAVTCDNTNEHGCGSLRVRRGSGRLRHHGGGSVMT